MAIKIDNNHCKWLMMLLPISASYDYNLPVSCIECNGELGSGIFQLGDIRSLSSLINSHKSRVLYTNFIVILFVRRGKSLKFYWNLKHMWTSLREFYLPLFMFICFKVKWQNKMGFSIFYSSTHLWESKEHSQIDS